jgi:hypothetical protein
MPRRHHLQVGKEAHAEGGKGTDGGSGSDGITTNGLLAEQVILVDLANGVLGTTIADTRATGIRNNGSIHRDDVGHGKEGRNACANLSEEVGPFALPSLICHRPRRPLVSRLLISRVVVRHGRVTYMT